MAHVTYRTDKPAPGILAPELKLIYREGKCMSYTMPITTDEARKGKSAKERTISSMEVAEMAGKDHDKLLRDIRNYIDSPKLASQIFLQNPHIKMKEGESIRAS